MKEYLTFTKRERVGILTLVVLLLAVAVAPNFISKPKQVAEKILPAAAPEKPPVDSSAAEAPPDTYYQKEKQYWGNNNYQRRYPSAPPFNRSAGRNYYGGYYMKNRSFTPSDRNNVYRSYAANYAAYHKPRYSVTDINAADTSAFIALPGIGSKLAARIVSFREKLGGFHSVDQIREVYGLRDSVFTMLVPLLRCDSVYSKKQLLSYNPPR